MVENEGIGVMDVNEVEEIDVGMDGGDEVEGEVNVMKGGGGGLFREKVIDGKGDGLIVVIDEWKEVEYVGGSLKV
ncbi:ribose-5-phosphate isomerase A, partial [Staphylococcus auricularis]|uniref:ribose-5-phosphate isomerase A n=1 Tax=Staphylococcus auricularis TaxID=29379 RepID=UPI0021E6603C